MGDSWLKWPLSQCYENMMAKLYYKAQRVYSHFPLRISLFKAKCEVVKNVLSLTVQDLS